MVQRIGPQGRRFASRLGIVSTNRLQPKFTFQTVNNRSGRFQKTQSSFHMFLCAHFGAMGHFQFVFDHFGPFRVRWPRDEQRDGRKYWKLDILSSTCSCDVAIFVRDRLLCRVVCAAEDWLCLHLQTWFALFFYFQ